MNAKNSMDRLQTILAVLLLLTIGGAVGFWAGRRGSRQVSQIAYRGQVSAPLSAGSEGAVPTSGGEQRSAQVGAGLNLEGIAALGGANALAAADQAAGTVVAVTGVTLGQDGWVAIHEDVNGKPGRILGARRFNAGANQLGVVELLRPTETGKTYFAVLHRDDGDRMFDFTKDTPIADAQGNAVQTRFAAIAAAGL